MPTVRHAFTDDGGGRFSKAVCWTYGDANCRLSAAISANGQHDWLEYCGLLFCSLEKYRDNNMTWYDANIAIFDTMRYIVPTLIWRLQILSSSSAALQALKFHTQNLNQRLVSHPQAIMKPFPYLQELIISKWIYKTRISLISDWQIYLLRYHRNRKYTVSTKKRPPWAGLKFVKISKLCAITI